jgi:glycosyltransferase involved in cell wall biosynthesis
MALPTLHIIGVFHGIMNDEFCHCAFSQKARKFSDMMVPLGYHCIEYSNEGSQSLASEHVVMLTKEEHEKFYPKQTDKEFHGSYAVIGERGWPLFNQRLIVELAKRVKKGDIICHPFGRSHISIPDIFPQCHSLEPGVGYPDKPWNAWRIYESSAWMHYHYGRDEQDPVARETKGLNRHYQWIIPNYFRREDWPFYPKEQNEDYVLFMSRITPEKGLPFLVEVIRENGRMAFAGEAKQLKFVFAGQGDFEQHVLKPLYRDPNPFSDEFPAKIEYRGPVTGSARAELVGKARCMILLTTFVEPFGGAIIEGMLTGTPAVTSDYGAFTETVANGWNGYRVKTLGDALAALEAVTLLNRHAISERARAKYSLETCGALYHRAFQQICEIDGAGWYSRRSFSIP